MIYALGARKAIIHAESFVADNATLIGSVVVKKNASIWFQAIIRGDNECITIGENSNIQDACVLHTDKGIELTIGENVTVGHKAMLHGCTIGNNTLIGINSVILNEAVIGNNCLIGANTLIRGGMEIPDGSLVVGSPGVVRRPLNDMEIAHLMTSAEHYVQNAKRYSRELVLEQP